MIKSVRLINFFSFGDCTIDLESDLNVLVGINGSGKSNFLRAFQLLKAGMDGKLREQIAQWGIHSMRYKNSIQTNLLEKIELLFTVSGDSIEDAWDDGYKGDITYRMIFTSDSEFSEEVVHRPDGYIYFISTFGKAVAFENAVPRVDFKDIPKVSDSRELLLPEFRFRALNLAAIVSYFQDLDIYKLFNTNDDAPMRTAIRATGIEKLLSNGDNVFQVLNTTGLRSTDAYDSVESGLHDVNEHFQRFRMNVYGQGSVEFYLQEKGLKTPIHAAQVSDGTLSYLCLLVALHQFYRGQVVVFDEPERNLHPDMLFELAKQLEKASEKSQIIITTHAPGLLNQFPLRAVRVFEKDETNQTIVKKFTEEDFAGWYDEFAPGQMWRNGDLGGNRY
jgi:predicted ATPase